MFTFYLNTAELEGPAKLVELTRPDFEKAQRFFDTHELLEAGQAPKESYAEKMKKAVEAWGKASQEERITATKREIELQELMAAKNGQTKFQQIAQYLVRNNPNASINEIINSLRTTCEKVPYHFGDIVSLTKDFIQGRLDVFIEGKIRQLIQKKPDANIETIISAIQEEIEARFKAMLKRLLYSGGRCGAYPDNPIYAYTINGFPANIQEFHPNKLVFMFHGFSGNSLDFLNWTQPNEENVLFVAPQGGGRTCCPKEGFTLEGIYCPTIANAVACGNLCGAQDKIREAAAKTRPILFKFMDDIRKQFGFATWDNVFVTGFSLGAILAYDVITHHTHLKYAAISSGAMDPNLNIPQEGKTILSVYSPQDRIVRANESKRSEEQFKGLNGTVKSKVLTVDAGGLFDLTKSHDEAGEKAYQSGIIWEFIRNPETFL